MPAAFSHPSQRRTGPSSRKVLLATGLAVGVSLPVFAGILLGLTTLMPACHGGGSSGSPMSGCVLAGIDLNPLLDLLTPAILLALVTVPVGVVLCLIGLLLPKKKAGLSLAKDDVGEALMAGLGDYRTGRPARTRCPRCRSVILFRPAVRTSGNTAQLSSACACGACDNAFDSAGQPG